MTHRRFNWRTCCQLVALVFVLGIGGARAVAQELAQAPAPSPAQTALWQGLARGMSPEQVAAIVRGMAGIKDVKVRQTKGKSEPNALAIRYVKTGIDIAGLPFELAPTFRDGRLDQVMLAARGQCEAKAFEVFDTLSGALKTKYPEPLDAPQQIARSDLYNAEQRALTSGKPVGLATAFASKDMAVMLTFMISVEQPPAVPLGRDRLSSAIYGFLRNQYNQKRAECEGTGDRRMDVVLSYLSRSDFDARVTQAKDEAAKAVRDVNDKL